MGNLNNAVSKDVTHTLISEQCTGCGACTELCPTGALSLKPDNEGFFKPELSKDLCTDCGLCSKRCVALNPVFENNPDPDCYAVMAKDEIRMESSSGGMFSIAAENIIDKNGYVCGAAFTSDLTVEHIIVNSTEELYKLRGSKYIQSNASKAFPEIKDLLSDGKIVLFTGLPCQVAGLYAHLGKKYDKLYTIDLLCHGITSYKTFNKYRKDVLGTKPIDRLYFKAKKPWGWHAGINAFFDDGTKFSCPHERDPFFKSYLGSLCKSTACAVCKQNRLPRQGDLSIGDFWGIEKIDPAFDDGKGTSVVLINNNKGQLFFDELKESMKAVRETPLSKAIVRNHCIEHPYPYHKNRHNFFKYLEKYPYAQLTKSLMNNRLYEMLYLDLVKSVPKHEHEYYYIAKIVSEHFKGRKVVTWIRSPKFEAILKKYFNIDVYMGVSMRKEALKDNYVEGFSMLRGKKDQYYLVALDMPYDINISKTLSDFGYEEMQDYVFRMHKPVVLENYDTSNGNYYDEYGNSIEGFRSVIGKVIFRGFNNHIMLGKNIPTAKNIYFDLCANSVVKIGDDCSFGGKCSVEVKGYNHSAQLRIGNRCAFYENSLFRFYNSEADALAVINDKCTSSSELGIHVNQGKRIIIGKDCMFSFENELWAGDGHTIFDVVKNENINGNLSNTYSPKNQLVLGDHVWVGKQAFILHGANIGTGSIIGARSLVSKTYPNNCTVAGNPANVSRENIAWSRYGMTTNINTCGSTEYVRLSSPANAPISGRKVLVIGGTRFMGKQLVQRLLELGNDVTIATRGRTPDDFGMFVDRIIMDVASAESTKKALAGKYFDVVFDNLSYCSLYTKNVLTNLNCDKYIQLSSMEAYVHMKPDMKEEYFNPYIKDVDIVDTSAGYVKGKRTAEAMAYKMLGKKVVTVRIPYVTKTERLLYYCKNVYDQTPMNIDDVSRGFTFVRDSEVGAFLPWIAAQNFTGPINLASEGMVTIKMILDHIEKQTGKKAIIDVNKGSESPFHVFGEKTFSLNLDKAKRLGYNTSKLHDWFWTLMNEYIKSASR